MPSEVLIKNGSVITATMTSLAGLTASTTTGGCQSAKIDFGTTPRAQQMIVRLQAAFNTAPVAGGALEVYVGFSSSTVTNVANVAALVGTDSAYSGYDSKVAEGKRQLTFVGVLSAANTTATQVADVGSFLPADRCCQIVVVNTASQPLVTTATWHAVTIFPVIDEAQ